MAAEDYVELRVFRKWMGRKEDDDSDDELLTVALAGAVKWINDTTGRRFTLDEVATPRTYRPARRTYWTEDHLHAFLVDDIGAAEGLVVEIGSNASGWSPVTAFETSPDNALADGEPITALLRDIAWQCGPTERLRVTARWGWPAVLDDVKQACLIQASRLRRRKDSPEGVMGGSEWGVVRLSRVDPDAQALISPLCLPGFA